MIFGISVIVWLIQLNCMADAIKYCYTPDNQLGDCIELKDCPVLLARFITNRYDPYLKQSACDHYTVINILFAFNKLILSLCLL